jgi:hypothetical protein
MGGKTVVRDLITGDEVGTVYVAGDVNARPDRLKAPRSLF